MKTKSLLFLLLFSILISEYSFAQYDDPNKDQIPVQFFYESNPQDVFAVITDASGFDNFNIGTDLGEPHLSSNPKNPLNYFTAYNINGGHYTLNGFDWVAISPGFTVSTNGDPVTAFDSLGNLFYENMIGGVTGTNIVKSINGGVSFSAAVSGNVGVDKNWIAADQTNGPFKNYLYTVMTSGSTASNVRRSIDNGASFGIGDTLANSYPGMMVCIGPNGATSGGSVYVVTNTGASAFAVTYNFYRSITGGTNFALRSSQNFAGYVGSNVSGRHSIQGMRTRPYPMIAADNSYGIYRGRFYVVYATNNPAGNGNKPNIYCRYSTDQGSTFSSAILVNDDTTGHQFFPAIWCDRTTGRLYCKWFDSRLTPTNDSMDVFASYSDNGGVTWAANQRITTQKAKIFCSTCGGGGTPQYQGDYDAITSNSKSSLMAWTDMRAGTFGSYTAYFPDFAMLATPSLNTIHQTNSSVSYSVNVPAVKLYTDVTTFTTSVTPATTTGNIVVDFPDGNTLNSYPNFIAMRVRTTGTVTPLGNYTISITGSGSNGTPVHKRNVTLTVNNTAGPALCENFSSVSFPPSSMFEEYSGTNYWSRNSVSAYGTGTGSAKFDFYSVSNIPTVQSLVSNNFAAVAANTYLTFDEAYAPFTDSTYGPDTLVIQSSSNFGSSYTTLATLFGKYDGTGELNTAAADVNPFTPSASQWSPKIYSLPVGTNKVRLTAKSGFGNNLYLDNVCVQVLPAAVSSSVRVIAEGMFIPFNPYNSYPDTISVYLHRTDYPNIIVDSAIGIFGTNADVSNLFFNKATDGSYYRVLKHRNCIETWSNAGIGYTRGSSSAFDFITPSGQSYGNNEAALSMAGFYGIYSGDVDQNGIIDLVDQNIVFNDASAFLTGYVISDVTGDLVVDLSDILTTYNNSSSFVQAVRPPGAEPKPAEIRAEKNINFENELVKQKYESGKAFMKLNESKKTENKSPLWNGVKTVKSH